MPHGNEKYATPGSGRPRSKKPPVSRQSGGTSGDLTVRDHVTQTPVSSAPYSPSEPMSTVQQQIRGVSSSPPVPSSILNTISDLLTPGPSAKEIAHAASTLGVKPLSTAAAEVVDKVADTAHDLGKGIKLAATLPDKRVDSFLGRETLGTPTVKQILKAATRGPASTAKGAQAITKGKLISSRSGSQRSRLSINEAGELVTPQARKAVSRLQELQGKRARIAGPLPGLDKEGTRVARKVLSTGKAQGATRKELLAAAETGLVETGGFHNYDYGDADSEGWRQERTSIYGSDANHPKQGALNFFSEAKDQSGATAGELAANIQRPAEQYRGRYDEVKPQAVAILNAFERGGKPGPELAAQLHEAKANARAIGINPTPFNGDVAGGDKDFTIVRADAKGMVDWVESAVGTVEGATKQLRWAGNFGLGSSEPWCANFVSNGLLRRGVTDLPSNPNYVPSYEGEWSKYALPRGLAEAKPGDLVTFSGSHIGVYVGGGEMVSGNSSDAVSRTPVGEPSMVIRPPYRGGKVKVADSAVPGSSLSAALGSAASAAGGANVSSGAPAAARAAASISSAQVPISALLATQSLTPAAYDQYQLGAAPEEEGEGATGTIARILARKRL